ncbi:MAG: DUF1232 domain-containing protein [Tannerellaceae bacterium]|jgi:uncharacterized membrane protein YkvA (DUF1232 family)|nr:DUF1232 domain-containing protein [Tannerellaceae bacterium]
MEDIENEKEIVRYERYYSEEGLADKLLKVARKAGVKVVYAVLLLYYTLLDGAFPYREKVIIIGALGYFIFPFDFIPDVLPLLGYTDDLLALIFAIRKVYTYVTPESRERAKAQIRKIFGEVDENEFNLF